VRSLNPFPAGAFKPSAVIVLLLALSAPAHFADGLPEEEAREGRVPDVALVDQDGRSVRLYSDLLKGRVAVISFIYTSCEAVCSLQGATYAKLQALVGDGAGREVVFISISADPRVDTPGRLKAWGERFGAKRGWTLLTGETSEIDRLALALTGDKARTGIHTPLVFIGDYERGKKIRANALADPSRLARYIESLRD
jgi:protein SCO1